MISSEDPKECSPNDFKIDEAVGKGTFGTVYKATDKQTGKAVAVKKVFQDPKYKNRELDILKELNHDNCVRMIKYFFSNGQKNDEIYLNIVMDFVKENLSRLIRYFKHQQKQSFPEILVKIYSYQMLRGIAYLHALNISHRDIKPENILINLQNQNLMICDLGSAKKLLKGESSISYICSRFYRAPELIVGATQYNTQIDIWSIGCVIAEMVLQTPIFPGKNASDQLVEIIKIMGLPTKEDLKNMVPEQKVNLNVQNYTPIKLENVFKSEKPEFIDFIQRLLCYDPTKRITAAESLLHPYFDDLKKKNQTINGQPLPDLYNFSDFELEKYPILRKLIS